jgi:uncharacterized metal-binding protein YceD (DUF177 family)
VVSTTEFSRQIRTEPWPEGGLAFDVVATEEERTKLAARFGLVELGLLAAAGRIERRGKELLLTGEVTADLAQPCVVTLEPVPAHLTFPIERRFRKGPAAARPVEIDLDLEGDEDEVDLIQQDEFDVGELVAEELCLALDPYPRVSGADQALSAMQCAARRRAGWSRR